MIFFYFVLLIPLSFPLFTCWPLSHLVSQERSVPTLTATTCWRCPCTRGMRRPGRGTSSGSSSSRNISGGTKSLQSKCVAGQCWVLIFCHVVRSWPGDYRRSRTERSNEDLQVNNSLNIPLDREMAGTRRLVIHLFTLLL